MVGLELGLGLGTKRAGAFSRLDHHDGRHDVQRDRQGRQRDDESKRTGLLHVTLEYSAGGQVESPVVL